MGASTCRPSGACARRSAISRGATATQDSQYKYDPGNGNIRICRAAERNTKRQPLEWIFRTRKHSKFDFFSLWVDLGGVSLRPSRPSALRWLSLPVNSFAVL